MARHSYGSRPVSLPTERTDSPGSPRRETDASPRREAAVTIALGLLCLVVLLVSARGAPLGVPATDDYLFLHHHRFGHVSWFDSDGAAWYWRPVSRQFYFGVLGPVMLAHPSVVVAVHALLLFVTYLALASLARRVMPAPAARLAAAFPLLCEPARVLLAWPSAAQHLIAMAGISTALASAAAGRIVPALCAEAFALGSLESALLTLPLLPLVAPAAGRLRWTVATAGLGLVWLLARLAVAAHGVIVPDAMHDIAPAALSKVLFLSLRAQLGLEDLAPGLVVTIAAALAVLGGLAVILARGRPVPAPAGSSRRLQSWALVGLVFWVAATIPLAGVLPNWNAWRSCVPGLGIGVAIAGLLSAAPGSVATAFLILRAVVLLMAPLAPRLVTVTPPPSASDLSFVRLARLQRTLIGVRAALEELPHADRPLRVRYWDFPLLGEYAFAGPRALQVWREDSTALWLPFGESTGFRDTTSRVLVFDLDSPRGVVWLRPEAQDLLRRADEAAAGGDARRADDLLARIPAAQPEAPRRLTAVVLGNRATLALRLGEVERADSLHRSGEGFVPAREWLQTEIAVALARGDTLRAVRALRAGRSLADAR